MPVRAARFRSGDDTLPVRCVPPSRSTRDDSAASAVPNAQARAVSASKLEVLPVKASFSFVLPIFDTV